MQAMLKIPKWILQVLSWKGQTSVRVNVLCQAASKNWRQNRQ